MHQFLAIRGLWAFHLVRGNLANARGLAENLHALAQREQNSDLLIEAHHALGVTCFFLGRFDEARTHLSAARSLDDPNRQRSQVFFYGQDPGTTAKSFLARTFWILGEIEHVEPLALEAIGLARGLEHPFTMVFALTSLSWIYSTLRNAKKTRELADEAIAISTQYSFELGLAWATSFQGWALAENGQEEGLAKLINGLSATQATGRRIILAGGVVSTERRTAAGTVRRLSPGSRRVFVRSLKDRAGSACNNA